MALAFTILCLALQSPEGSVDLELIDGRWLAATSIGQGSTANTVALDCVAPGIHLTRRVPWSRIASVRFNGVRYSSAEFRRLILPDDVPVLTGPRLIRRDLPTGNLVLLPISPGIQIGSRTEPDPAEPNFTQFAAPQVIQPIEPPQLPPPPVAAFITGIVAESYPANLGGGLDWNTLVLRVGATDALGQLIPVSGTLRATLYSRRQRLVRVAGRNLAAQTLSVGELASWTRVIADPAAECGASPRSGTADSAQLTCLGAAAPYTLNLPLPSPLPEHDFSWDGFGELSLELTVPGRGMFSTTLPAVPLRRFSPLRDDLFTGTGSRFFTGESTTDNRRQTGPRFFQGSSLRPDSPIFTIQP